MRLHLLGTLALVAAACSPKNNGTLLVARVDTDLTVGASGAIDSIQIEVVPQHGGGSSDTFPLTSRASLPSVGIVPSGDPAFSVDVTATGRKGSSTIVSQTATVAFAPGEAREFTLFLAQDCAGASACTPATNVCIKGGSCVAKTEVVQTKPYVPAGVDAGTGIDAPRDTGFDAGGRDARDNPGQWVAVSPAFPSTTATLYGVWPLADGSVWVAGASGSRGIVGRFVAGLWAEAVLPTNAPTLFGIWASGPSDVWAVGINGTVLHYDGGPTMTWTTVSISGTQPTATLTGVWGASSADVWIVGQGGLILHGSATGIAAEPSGTTADLAGIWGLSATDVWAVAARAPVLRRNATGWTVQTATLGSNIYYGIWLAAPNDAWIAGDRATLHNDGAAWTQVANPLDSATSIWGSASDDVWSVGRPVTGGTTFISRFNGVQWVAATSPSTMPLQAVRGASATNVWAVGNGGTVLRLQVP
jgi:hypothetical protein